MSNPLFVLSMLGLLVAISEGLGKTPWGRHLGSALWVIVLTAVVANLGILPTYSDDITVYSGIFTYVAPLAIFLLVLQVNLRQILKAGMPMIGMFLLGAAGTTAGVFAGLWAVDGANAFGTLYHALGGMFVATYTGGSMNYNAVALHYDVVKQGALYAGAAAVDSAMTTVWMAVTVFVPRLLGERLPAKTATNLDKPTDATAVPAGVADGDPDSERVDARDLGLLTALSGLSVWISNAVGEALGIPSILVLTTLALALAQLEPVRRLRGARLMGWLAVMFFLAVIGALCDLRALAQLGEIGLDLVIFVIIVLAVHGAVIFGVGAALKVDPTLTAVASQANVGGSTSALALARSLEREEWVLPGVLAGALGNALGTYMGFAVAAML